MPSKGNPRNRDKNKNKKKTKKKKGRGKQSKKHTDAARRKKAESDVVLFDRLMAGI